MVPLLEMFRHLNFESPIDKRIQEIANIRASVKNGSDYCLHTHMDLGLKAGLTHKQIDLLRYDPGGGEFTEKEQVVIEYTEKMTQDANSISDELFAKVRQHFSESEIINLTLVIAMINAFNRYSDALKLHPEDLH